MILILLLQKKLYTNLVFAKISLFFFRVYTYCLTPSLPTLLSMEQEALIKSFWTLSGPRKANVVALFTEMGSTVPDFYEALVKVASRGWFTAANASSAIVSHLTESDRSRADALLKSCATPGDNDQAIIIAWDRAYLTKANTTISRMRALTGLSKSRVEFYLDGTKPAARESKEITERTTLVALFRVLTSFSAEHVEQYMALLNFERSVPQISEILEARWRRSSAKRE